jgi:hypothetical protein
MKANGFTIFELLMFFATIAIGTLCGGLAWHKFGWLGLIAGFLGGVIILPAFCILGIFLFKTKNEND